MAWRDAEDKSKWFHADLEPPIGSQPSQTAMESSGACSWSGGCCVRGPGSHVYMLVLTGTDIHSQVREMS